jgi:hypothetical protein
MLADGESYSTIETTVLRARYRGQPPTVLTPAMEADLGQDAAAARRWHDPPEYSKTGTRVARHATLSVGDGAIVMAGANVDVFSGIGDLIVRGLGAVVAVHRSVPAGSFVKAAGWYK